MNILVFAGTTEGRLLVEQLAKRADFQVCACVATEYGRDILEQDLSDQVEVKAGRLQLTEMQELIAGGFDWVVDATHPYATAVTENIQAACAAVQCPYLRLLRERTEFGEDCIFVEDTEAAVRYLNTTVGNVLLTTGSKELKSYGQVADYQERLYARVLPMEQVVKSCIQLGFSGSHLICMQGPFSKEMNVAMLKQLNCTCMVTKDTGAAGGAYEKYQAAQEAGTTLVVVGRAQEEKGLTLQQVLEKISNLPADGCKGKKGQAVDNSENINDTVSSESISQSPGRGALAEWFPLFVNLTGKRVVIVGGGKIARRRIETLLQFSCQLRIVASHISEEIRKAVQLEEGRQTAGGSHPDCRLLERPFQPSDLLDADFVLAATNNRELNRTIGKLCREKAIPVNVADVKEECDFYFPGIIIEGMLVAGVTAQGQSHSLAKKGSAAVRKAWKDIENR
ncbi:precorrin-6A reductase [Aminipila butyrica]|uniref:precorrin-2 dehydrogenase n=1 Tax=Aminipila butyrica TaxID=433296 RepID=A0A858BUZ2_9FIRM|nr:precorrin-6A reductase [Aminipila butyrica]QIB68885.1 precorrin-6A reductase [Aminipila butyrica]